MLKIKFTSEKRWLIVGSAFGYGPGDPDSIQGCASLVLSPYPSRIMMLKIMQAH